MSRSFAVRSLMRAPWSPQTECTCARAAGRAAIVARVVTMAGWRRRVGQTENPCQ